MVTRIPRTAGLQLRGAEGRVLQRINRVNPRLVRTDLTLFMQLVNEITRTDVPVMGGFYTVTDDLESA